MEGPLGRNTGFVNVFAKKTSLREARKKLLVIVDGNAEKTSLREAEKSSLLL